MVFSLLALNVEIATHLDGLQIQKVHGGLSVALIHGGKMEPPYSEEDYL